MNHNYIVFDIENDSTKRYKRKAGNFLYDQIVAYAWKTRDMGVPNASYIYEFGHESPGLFKPEHLIVGHNIKHDLLFVWEHTKVFKIWDTALVEYYLTEFQHKYPALRDIATNSYKCPIREKLMEKYWVEGKLTSEIPKELVLEDVINDVKDTEQVFLSQYKRCEELGILPLIEILNDNLLALIEIEYNGFKIDKELLVKNATDIEQELTNKEIQFQSSAKQYCTWEFNLNSNDDLSLLFYGGIKTLNKKKKSEFTLKVQGLKILPLEKCAKEGFYKTNENILQQLLVSDIIDTNVCEKAKEIINLLLEIRGLSKQLKTYYVGFKELIYDADSCVHSNFNCTATNTGRLSCDNPNLQNIPRKGTNKIKQHFITRY